MITESLNQELSRENKNLQPANDPVGDKQSTGAHQSTSTLEVGSNVPDQKPHDQSLIEEPLIQATQLMERLKNLSKNDQHDISTALDSAEASHEVFYLCAILFWNQFKTDLGTMKDLDVAIDLGTRALQILSDHAPERPGYLFELGSFYQTRYKRVGKLEDIAKAVELAEQAISLVPDEHSSKPRYFSGLGISYSIRFHRLDTLADMEKSIECQEQAVRLTPDDSTERRARLNNLGSAYQSLFERLGRTEDLDKSISLLEQAMQLTKDDHPHRPVLLNNLGNAYQSLFQHLGKLTDLEKSIGCFERMIPLVPDDHPHKCVFLNNLGGSYRVRFERLGTLEDLEKSIGYKIQAVELVSDDEPFKPLLLHNLGNSYQSLFERFGRLGDLEKAIGYLEQAVRLAPDDDPDTSEYLNCLGISYRSRFNHLDQQKDIEKCIDCFERAVHLTPDDRPHKPTILSNLGAACHSLFRRSGTMQALDKSVKSLEQALLLASDDEPHKFTILINLGNARQLQFWRLGKSEHLTQAIGYFERAEQLAPDDHPARLELLTSLGKAYRSMFDHLGRIVDLDRSISYLEKLVGLTSDDEPLKPERLNDLGDAYQSLFERLGRLEDLDKSIERKESAVKLTPIDHSYRSGYIANLGKSYLQLFDRLGKSEDLNTSVDLFEQAVQLTPNDHPDRSTVMSNLGTAYHLRFKNLGRLEDLEKSASCNAQAVDLTPEGHPDKPIYLRNQGDSYYSLFRRIGGPDDLRESIRCLERATQLTSDDHLYKPVFLMSLGAVYSDMFESSSLQEDASNALAALKHASLLSGGSPAIKLRASKMWAQLLARTGISPLDAYTRAMALVPQVVWLGVSMKDRYEGLSEDIQGLVSDATTAAVRLQCYDLAIEWLEQGRSIVWSQMMQLRTPLDTLHASHPAMAEKLRHISNELENLSIPSLGKQALSQDSASLHEVAQSHRRLAEKREELLDSIRSLDGFDDFLRPLSFNKLVQHVKNGVAVMINIHESDCDALIVQSGSVEVGHVLLSEFSVQKANDAHLALTSYLHAEGIHRGIKRCHKDTNATFTSALRMLWSDVVHPVLEYLNITRVLPAHDDNLPHITWCTTGILSFLPLHAAGDHTYPNKVLANLAVSSYAPTLGSLSPSGSPTDPFFGILAVGHESAIRGFSALPGTRAELDRVAASASGLPFTRLDGKKACVSSVLEAMMSHSWVHIACHGSQDPSDPMKSAFHLHDKDLDLATIARYPLKNARLAFLSACQTATGHATLPDESVHLAAGLLMSGYSTVIATMWSIHDQDAPLVAEKFYELLLKGGAVDSQQAANALHRAVASLREKIGVENYARWMPYIHLGC